MINSHGETALSKQCEEYTVVDQKKLAHRLVPEFGLKAYLTVSNTFLLTDLQTYRPSLVRNLICKIDYFTVQQIELNKVKRPSSNIIKSFQPTFMVA